MKTIKYIDQVGQAVMVLGGLIYTFATDGLIFRIYFLTGGWQVASFFVHLFAGDYTWYNNQQRGLYGKTLICTFLATMLFLFIGSFTDGVAVMLFLFATLIITPFFAAWYFYIGITEIRLIKQKELIHLK